RPRSAHPLRLEHAPHLDADRREIPMDPRASAFDEPEIHEGECEVGVRINLEWFSPAQLAARLRAWRSVDRTGAKDVNEIVKTSWRPASRLVRRDGPQVGRAIARLLEEFAPRRILETLVPLHVPARQEPRAREGTGALSDDEDTSGVIDARDDRADLGPLPLGPSGHAR